MISVKVDEVASLKKLWEVRKILMDGGRAGKYWKPIPHYDLVTDMIKQITARGWRVSGARLSLSRSYQDMAATWDVIIPSLSPPKGQTFGIGVINSNSQRRRLRIAVGSTVQVCLNGMITGCIVLNKKHTICLDLNWEIHNALDEYLDGVRMIKHDVACLRRVELSEGDVAKILVTAGRERLMPWSRLGDVDREHRHPRHKEFKTGTSWGLLNAFTSVVKRNPAVKQMEQMSRFFQLVTMGRER